MKGLSASRMDRIMHCAPSVLLPQVKSSNDLGDRGIEVHKFMRQYALGGGTESAREAALATVPEEYKDVCETLDLAKIRVSDWSRTATEVRYVYDPRLDTARIAADDEDKWDDEIPAFCDLVVESEEDGIMMLVDYKTGHGKISAPFDNWQLRLAAICASKLNPWADRFIVVLLYLDMESGEPHEKTAEFNLFDLAGFSCELEKLVVETLPKTDVDDIRNYRLGSWCSYCPAIRSCKAQMALVHELVALPDGIPSREVADRVVPTDSLGPAYRKLQAIRAMVAVAESAFHAIATENPIDLGNGEFLGGHETQGKRQIDGQAAFDYLEHEFSHDVAKAAATIEVSQKSIKSALKKFDLPQAPNLKALLDSLSASGKVKRKKGWRVEVFKPALAIPESGSDE